MKKFLALGVLAAIFFLVPAVQAQDWYGPRGHQNCRSQGACGPAYGGYHNSWGHQPPPRWGHANWQHGGWHRQPAGWGYNHPDGRWNRPPLGLQRSSYYFS